MNKEPDEYPASVPELNTFWEDSSGWLYLVTDYDHWDHAVHLLGIANKYSENNDRHNGYEYAEVLFHFDNLYTQTWFDEEEKQNHYRTLVQAFDYFDIQNYWDNIDLPEEEKRLMLLSKVP